MTIEQAVTTIEALTERVETLERSNRKLWNTILRMKRRWERTDAEHDAIMFDMDVLRVQITTLEVLAETLKAEDRAIRNRITDAIDNLVETLAYAGVPGFALRQPHAPTTPDAA